MATVFLSYDHEDVAKAAPIAAALEKAGHSVWWDQRISAGAEYNREIEGAVERADAVVVLWSAQSVHSAWVRDEAAEGRDRGKLVPVTIDHTKPPMGFRQYQTIDLSKRKRGGGLMHIDELVRVVGNVGRADEIATARTSVHALSYEGRRFNILWPVLAALAVLLVGTAFVAWRMMYRPSVPVIAVAPGGNTANAEATARSLLVKLGSLRSARTDAVQLIGATVGLEPRADFVFEAAADEDRRGSRGSIALLAGNDRSILWSRDFDVERGNRTAIEQSMAYTASQVLDCALQANAESDDRLDQQTLKLFLNGCALFGDRYRADPASVVPIFSQVVVAAPTFEPGWSKLLLAEAQSTRGQMMFYDRLVPGRLPEHVRVARKLNPRLPELYIAQAALLPLSAFEERLRLIDEAVKLNPDNADLLVARSEFLHGIGSNSDALEDARRVVELNPLSPGFRSNLIQMLTYSGQLPAAEEELRRAQQLWPGNRTIEDARFRLHSRYGDAKDALRLLQSPDFRQSYPTMDMEAYLFARIDPTEANIETAMAAVRSAQLSPARKVSQLAQLFADFGRNDELFRLLMSLPPDRIRLASQGFYRPNFRIFLHDPRFMQVARRARLLDFWRTSERWPDFCLEPSLPYDCKEMAAKVIATTA